MSNVSKFISLCNPCSTKHKALDDFAKIDTKHKVLVGTVTAVVGILTLPLFGLLAVLTFRCLVKKFNAKDLSKMDQRKQGFENTAEKTNDFFSRIKALKKDKIDTSKDSKQAKDLDPLRGADKLLKQPADFPEVKGYDLPLHRAAEIGDLDHVKYYISRVRDINSQTKLGKTALKLAAEAGQTEAVELLLKNGADANIVDLDKYSPLHAAATYGHIEIVKLLLNNKANINAKSKEGWTPLFFALAAGHKNIANLLIERGADQTLKMLMARLRKK